MWSVTVALALLLWPVAVVAADGPQLADRADPGAVVVDVRPADTCLRASLPGALCLPAGDLTGTDGRLANFRDILWLLGTLGLDGSEHVAVGGDAPEDVWFVAGVLHVAGQARVDVLAGPLTATVSAQPEARPGKPRGLSREAIYTALMRDHLIVLRDDLQRGREAGTWRPVDGRAVAEETLPQQPLVAYGEDPASSLATFARLRAVHAADAVVYIGGWRDWQAGKGGERLVHPAVPAVGFILVVALVLSAFVRRKRCSF